MRPLFRPQEIPYIPFIMQREGAMSTPTYVWARGTGGHRICGTRRAANASVETIIPRLTEVTPLEVTAVSATMEPLLRGKT